MTNPSHSPKVREQLEKRQNALLTVIKSYKDDLKQILPVKPEEVKQALESIDELTVVGELIKTLNKPFNCKTEKGEYFKGLKYEWYYGGKQNYDVAYGYASEKCKPKGYSKTDLVKVDNVWLERNEPELSGETAGEEEFFLDITLVMKKWYDDLALRYNNFDYSEIIDTPLHKPFNDSENIYNELFRIKLYTLVERAASSLFKENVPFIFLGLHGRWPVLVAGE